MTTHTGRQPTNSDPERSGYWLRQRTIVALLLAYLLSSIALTNWFLLAEVVKAALALPAFALVPLLIGHTLLRASPSAVSCPMR